MVALEQKTLSDRLVPCFWKSVVALPRLLFCCKGWGSWFVLVHGLQNWHSNAFQPLKNIDMQEKLCTQLLFKSLHETVTHNFKPPAIFSVVLYLVGQFWHLRLQHAGAYFTTKLMFLVQPEVYCRAYRAKYIPAFATDDTEARNYIQIQEVRSLTSIQAL